MSNSHLGRLEKVELRKIWQNEASEFTPWLAQKDNLTLLSDAIGLELVLEGVKKSVAPFHAASQPRLKEVDVRSYRAGEEMVGADNESGVTEL